LVLWGVGAGDVVGGYDIWWAIVKGSTPLVRHNGMENSKQ